MIARLSQIKTRRHQRRQRRRRQVRGTADRPRLCVHISAQHIRLQVIDDQKGRTLAAVSTVNRQLKEPLSQQATLLGEEIAKLCKAKKIQRVVFDTGRFAYKKRLGNLAAAARKGGLKF